MTGNTQAPPDDAQGNAETSPGGAQSNSQGNSTASSQTTQPAFVTVDHRDYGHAEVLASLLHNKLRWNPKTRSWLFYTDGYWRWESEEAVAKIANDALRKWYAQQMQAVTSPTQLGEIVRKITECCVYNKLVGVLSFLKGWENIMTRPEEWDRDGWLLNVRNGTLDLRTLRLRSHRPDDLLTQIAPVRYDAEAKAPLWEQHLDRFLPNPNVRRQVQRDLGLGLVGKVLEEIFPIWYGEGRNGKTTTLRTIMAVLGDDYATKPIQGLLVQQRWQQHSTVLTDLAGARLVFASETEQGQRLAESLIKDLTGGEGTRARRLYENSKQIRQTFTIFLITNHKPIILGRDVGIWKRIRLVPWEQQIAKKDRRPQDEVISSLLTEAPGILNWLLDGLRDWKADPYWVADEVQAATNIYRAEGDPLADFLADRCLLGARYHAPKAEVYDAYVKWCDDNYEQPVSRRFFNKLLIDQGIGEDRIGHNRVWVYRGIRLLNSAAGSQEPEAEPQDTEVRSDADMSLITSQKLKIHGESYNSSDRMCPQDEQPEPRPDTEQPEPPAPPPDTEQQGERRPSVLGEWEAAIAEFMELAVARNFEPFRLDGYRTIMAGSEAWGKFASTAEPEVLREVIAALRAAREKPPRVGDVVWCLNGDGSIANPEPLKIVGVEIGPNLEPYAMLDGEDGVTGWPLLRCYLAEGDPTDCSV